MEILLAEKMGLCFGVRRAIELAEAELRDGNAVSILGSLVHNHQEIARLGAAGIHTVDSAERITGDTVVIRAHGETPAVFQDLQQRQLRIVDATCPFVKRSQRYAGQFTGQDYTLVIVGHPDHPEVQGVLGYATTPAYVISQPDEVASLPAGITPLVIAQTTVTEDTFRQVVAAIAARYPEHTVRNTICLATRERQDAARELAQQAEVVYVIGGRHSSNTKRLVEICHQHCTRTYHIESAEDIRPADLVGIQRVGVTAGASTPAWLIQQVVDHLQQLSGV
ncbi:MAG: 4-hydroxy-3-methylbut-2-enyl diphosphate reductase [Armatimonadota bacterium]